MLSVPLDVCTTYTFLQNMPNHAYFIIIIVNCLLSLVYDLFPYLVGHEDAPCIARTLSQCYVIRCFSSCLDPDLLFSFGYRNSGCIWHIHPDVQMIHTMFE
jgi:hypothetical protein